MQSRFSDAFCRFTSTLESILKDLKVEESTLDDMMADAEDVREALEFELDALSCEPEREDW